MTVIPESTKKFVLGRIRIVNVSYQVLILRINIVMHIHFNGYLVQKQRISAIHYNPMAVVKLDHPLLVAKPVCVCVCV